MQRVAVDGRHPWAADREILRLKQQLDLWPAIGDQAAHGAAVAVHNDVRGLAPRLDFSFFLRYVLHIRYPSKRTGFLPSRPAKLPSGRANSFPTHATENGCPRKAGKPQLPLVSREGCNAGALATELAKGVGLEPTTCGFGDRRSSQLSYPNELTELEGAGRCSRPSPRLGATPRPSSD